MTKNERLDILFTEWEGIIPAYYGNFHKDGIIDELCFQNAIHKILYIAKEPNNPREVFDFRDWWKGPLSHTFTYRIAEWSHGILNKFPKYDEIWKEPKQLNISIRQIAFMNIKKSGGTGSSNLETMEDFIDDLNKSFILNEIEIIDPEIIILGLTWPAIRNKLFSESRFSASGYEIEIGKYKNARIIDFYHPSSRNAPVASYCLLQKIFESEEFNNL